MGLIWEYYEDRQVKSHTRVEEGRPHGGSVAYFPNGQVQIREFYRQGVSHGKTGRMVRERDQKVGAYDHRWRESRFVQAMVF